MLTPNLTDTICALATPQGTGAVAIIRISGSKTTEVLKEIFVPNNGKTVETLRPRYAYLGNIEDGGTILDQVLCTLFRGKASYTGEDSAEISCHGSPLIQRNIIALLIEKGVRMAERGEFTLRGFRNGKFDLAQAEAVADLIAAESTAAHDLALQQMRGGYSSKINTLREKLVKFAALIELELDFSEEDVAFADREQLFQLLGELKKEINLLITSFQRGNVIKKGIPVAIIGKPNAGKSTLLNALLNEERAIVSEIPGTTRDTIEDTIQINGYTFRFIDTAGLHESQDTIEKMGIQRTIEKINQAKVILHLFDLSTTDEKQLEAEIAQFQTHLNKEEKKWILIANKADTSNRKELSIKGKEILWISAKKRKNIHLVTEALNHVVEKASLTDRTIVSNTRHYEALLLANQAIEEVEQGFKQQIPSDLVAIDIRSALHHLGSITGAITSDEILGNIFNQFCIGK
ncbi:MAG: tRNA uridine-5-carboxymethylaminomethyl(34) synthesis GTPase MnmE [Bacteroidetes bacterium]|nr:MAG: tRNA uridine-5-carboxymethylaminomethyl(34) synthesis GTPase MnmE [Bacteroidota bacterium]PIE87751.1 MAG: tRNA uridine-5-carboxymethylaminomethyl(34) synthesis GTPase MnmE [Bacteroidota bacterium]